MTLGNFGYKVLNFDQTLWVCTVFKQNFTRFRPKVEAWMNEGRGFIELFCPCVGYLDQNLIKLPQILLFFEAEIAKDKRAL